MKKSSPSLVRSSLVAGATLGLTLGAVVLSRADDAALEKMTTTKENLAPVQAPVVPTPVVQAPVVPTPVVPTPTPSLEPPLTLEDKSTWFPFVIPTLADARTANSPIDLSFLSPEAAGTHGFLRARGEKVVDGRGREVRLFGTNICDWHVMPPKEMALPIARRLRQLGVNFIRLHYYDFEKAPNGIFKSDLKTFDPQKLAQMDWLIYQLKQHGIYVDLNLKVARHYPEMPDDWDWMGKSLDRVEPRLIALQKQFARDMLNHVNPYTKRAYKDEPAIAVIEINNENSALQTDTGVWFQYSNLDETMQAPIRAKWNAWLRKRYGTTAKLLAAWRTPGPETEGPELLRNVDLSGAQSEWGYEASGGAQASLGVQLEGDQRWLHWNATKSGNQSWNLQLSQNVVGLEDGQTVRLRFRARANEPRLLNAALMQNEDPWGTIATTTQAALTPQWKEFDYTLKISSTGDRPIRLSFSTNNYTGVYDIAGVSLREGGKYELHKGTSVEAGNVPLVSAGQNPLSGDDFTLFVGELDRAYTAEMMTLLRQEIGVKSLIWDTQANYGGAQGLLRESRYSDALDAHAYPSHPAGTRVGDQWMWRVQPKSLLGEAMWALPSMSQVRLKGKPFFVTEFDLNPPSDFASESYPLLALMASYQGWAGFGEYSWLNFQKDLNPTRIQSAFGTTGHAGQMAFMPTAALLYRLGLVRQATHTATLAVTEKALLSEPIDWSATSRPWEKLGYQNGQGWTRRLDFKIVPGSAPTRIEGKPFAPLPKDFRTVLKSDSGEIVVDYKVANRETLTLNAPAVRYVFGFTGGRSFAVGDVRLDVQRGTRLDYGNFSVISLDGLPIKKARNLLVTAVARTENKGQRYDANRTTVGFDFGEGPVLAEPMRFSFSVPGTGWKAFALDGQGQIASSVSLAGGATSTRLQGDPRHRTLWYLLRR